MKKSRSITSKLPAALALVVVAALWCFASEGGWVPAFMLPSPRAVVQALLSDAPVLAANAAVTLQEAAWGLLIGIVVALVLSTLMHRVRWLYRALYPILVITQTIPTIAIAPLLVLWMGFGMAPKRGKADAEGIPRQYIILVGQQGKLILFDGPEHVAPAVPLVRADV